MKMCLLLVLKGNLYQSRLARCADSTGCKKAGNNDDFHKSRRGQMFNMRVIWMRISFEYLQ